MNPQLTPEAKKIIEILSKEIGKQSTAPDKETPDWMLTDIKNGMIAALTSPDLLKAQGLTDEWVSADVLPDIDKDVLCYYEIEQYKYYVIGCVRSVTESSGGKYAEWIDKDYNAIRPTYYQPLPTPPTK